jgi:pimeloyl-ACP methyl ester carboxylesterase
MRAFAILPLFLLAALAQTTKTHDFDVAGDKQFTDTQIDLKAGETVKITATGSMQSGNPAKQSGPEGAARGWLDMVKSYPVLDGAKLALIGKIGDRETARAFLIGPSRTQKVALDGRLYLGLNMMSNEKVDGAFHVHIERTIPPVSKTDPNVTLLTQAQLDSVPTRVQDKDGNLGDRVNFFVVGSENQVRSALLQGGWTKVDKDKKQAVFEGLLNSLSKQAYVSLPMSELMLFGRVQDYGYAQGDPLKVIASRHHFRIWKAPFTVGGATVWAGAGTHDIGFDRDNRNNGVTHRIDPETDKERDYIAASFAESGLVVKTDYMSAKDPITGAKTATGSEFKSDGRTAIIYLTPDVADQAASFGDHFCTVLARDPGNWGDCSKYLDSGGKTDAKLKDLNTKYRVLIIPGFMSSCFPESPAFQEGQQILKTKYGMTVDLFAVPNDPSDSNAKLIADFIKEQRKSDDRKFILIGYSKGTPDAQVALATDPEVSAAVAAFITVAGASGGSQIAEIIPGMADAYIKQYFKLDNCKGDVAAGFKSLKRSERRAFLSQYPDSPVPTYSIITYSDATNTSKGLMQTWQMLAAYDTQQDGQLTRQDAIVPGAKFLGALRGDHFSVALPFENSQNEAIRMGMDKTRFPRAALLEALVRYVTGDLAAR